MWQSLLRIRNFPVPELRPYLISRRGRFAQNRRFALILTIITSSSPTSLSGRKIKLNCNPRGQIISNYTHPSLRYLIRLDIPSGHRTSKQLYRSDFLRTSTWRHNDRGRDPRAEVGKSKTSKYPMKKAKLRKGAIIMY